MDNRGMPYPTVFCVDGQVGFPPLPPKPGQRKAQYQRYKVTQTLLFLLVIMALCGILVEACFIYNLYNTKQDKLLREKEEASRLEARKGGKAKEHITVPPRTRRPAFLKPSKPLAHLSAGSSRPGSDWVMPWNGEVEDLYELKFNAGKLEVQKEGYYYIYSKLCYNAGEGSFYHAMVMTTPRYQGVDPIELLRYRYSVGLPQTANTSGSVRNSYLGGVFHLLKGDTVFVLVKKGTVLLQSSGDNFFGMFMV
ncbi:tumor necrosis factor ligand superfamily member 14 [Salminus brasiliensis]|uniref:tumor necrosis factor ligand superfamily member 14 n=1 Tax=Salminus brasiliensis TaxID=930266 RepID=UPI003B8379FD